MDPVNFNFADPSQAVLNGIKTSAVLGQISQQAQDRQLALQQQQIAQQQAIQQQMDLQRVAMNPNATPQDYARLMTQYPALADHLAKPAKVMEDAQRQNLLDFQSRLFSAQMSGNTELFDNLLTERKTADPSNAQHYQMLIDVNKANPAAARSMLGMSLAAALGPDKFAEGYAKIGGEQRAQELQPAVLKKAEGDASQSQAEAVIKTEQAKVAPQAVLLDLQKKGWDIQKIQADIAHQKEQNRLKAMEIAQSKAGNDLKRQELQLKIQETQQKMADQIREKAATVETSRTSMDNLLNTTDRFLQMAVDPKTGKVTSTLRAAAGPVDSRMPTMQQDVADLEALVETLGSQAFLAQVPNMKGLGALSNAEGEKLQSALQNLSLRQSPERLVENIKEAQRLILKGRKALVTRYGVPDTVPDTPAAAAAAGPAKVDALVQKYLNPQAAPGRKN